MGALSHAFAWVCLSMPNGAKVEVPVQKENYVPFMQKVERPGPGAWLEAEVLIPVSCQFLRFRECSCKSDELVLRRRKALFRR